jgi:hypothetical protein
VRLAADHVQEHLSKFIIQKPEIIEGADQSSRLSTDNLKKAGWNSGSISSTDHNGRHDFFSFSANAAAQDEGVPDGARPSPCWVSDWG